MGGGTADLAALAPSAWVARLLEDNTAPCPALADQAAMPVVNARAAPAALPVQAFSVDADAALRRSLMPCSVVPTTFQAAPTASTPPGSMSLLTIAYNSSCEIPG